MTELVTGIDLVREQLRVAAGEPLVATGRAPRRGHAIEIRLNAEDPGRDFRPRRGGRALPRAARARRASRHVRRVRLEISPYYDSMIAKLIVWDTDRDAAIARAERALRETVVEGIPTTASSRSRCSRATPFRSGEYSTSTLEALRAVAA